MDRLETAPDLARTIQVAGEQFDVHAIVFFIDIGDYPQRRDPDLVRTLPHHALDRDAVAGADLVVPLGLVGSIRIASAGGKKDGGKGQAL
jgi:hypothetical protein